jgi:fibronectin type 3 domain-containing protein
VVPRPITAVPVDELTFTDSVEFDRERCYEVRAVRGTGPDAVESAPTERRCLTPVDVFEPTPPTNLATVVRPGAIDLIWEASPELDVWGYVILRGTAGDATLQPLNAAPVIEAQFTDTTVTPGTRYVYAVIAVDTRLPVPNISGESARIEETAR